MEVNTPSELMVNNKSLELMSRAVVLIDVNSNVFRKRVTVMCTEYGFEFFTSVSVTIYAAKAF